MKQGWHTDNRWPPIVHANARKRALKLNSYQIQILPCKFEIMLGLPVGDILPLLWKTSPASPPLISARLLIPQSVLLEAQQPDYLLLEIYSDHTLSCHTKRIVPDLKSRLLASFLLLFRHVAR